MDDAVDAEELRALAIASLTQNSNKSPYTWIGHEREEGELSSEEDTACMGAAKPRNRRRQKKKALQSAAPPTGVPNLPQVFQPPLLPPASAQMYRDHLRTPQVFNLRPPPHTVQTQQQTFNFRPPSYMAPPQQQMLNLQPPSHSQPQQPVNIQPSQVTQSQRQPLNVQEPSQVAPSQHQVLDIQPPKDKNGQQENSAPAAVSNPAPNSTVATQTPRNGKPASTSATKTPNNTERPDNQFLIKFSDDESESEGEAAPDSSEKAALNIPENLSMEINRMKKQIAAMERVKGKSLPIQKSTRPAKPSMTTQPPFSNQYRLTPGKTGNQTNVECLRKQIASKESEIRQRKEAPQGKKPVTDFRSFKYQRTLDVQKNTLQYNSSQVPQSNGPEIPQNISTADDSQNHSSATDSLNHSSGTDSQNHSSGTDTQNHSPPTDTQNHSPPTDSQNHSPPTDSQNHPQPNDSQNHLLQNDTQHHSHGNVPQNNSSDSRNISPLKRAAERTQEETEANKRAKVDSTSVPMEIVQEATPSKEISPLVVLMETTPTPQQQCTPQQQQLKVSEDRAIQVRAPQRASLRDLEMEEDALDKELESAQHHRHMCEIRERLARKAYREAQEALRQASMKCEKLHRERDMISLRVKAAELDVLEEDLIRPVEKMDMSPLSNQEKYTEEARHKLEENTAIITINEVDAVINEANPAETISEKDIPNASLPDTELEKGEGNFMEDSAGHSHPPDEAIILDDQAYEEKGERISNEKTTVKGASQGEEASSASHSETPEPEKQVLERGDNVIQANSSINKEENILKQAITTDTLFPSEEVVDNNLKHREECPENNLRTGGKVIFPTKLDAGRLVVFRHVLSKPTGEYTLHMEEKKSSHREVCGDYESPLKNFRTPSESILHQLDVFRPLCRYEHRGKCNNELCTYQHLKKLPEDLRSQKTGIQRWTKFAVPVPTYRIASYPMRDWREYSSKQDYSSSHAFAFLTAASTQRPLPQDMPCLLDDDKSTASPTERDLNGSLDFLQIDSSNEKKVYADLITHDLGVDACLDLALNILQYDIYLKNSNCLKNALCILSRGLEADKTSVALWVVYIMLLSMRPTLNKKDDMVLHAVRLNKYSYELWNLVHSTRTNLSTLLASYKSAIFSLCEGKCESSCILDIVLKMLNTLIMSESNEMGQQLDELVNGQRWSTVWESLSANDGLTLWLSCAYFCAYGGLPQSVIDKLGCKQDLSTFTHLEWEVLKVNEETRSKVVKLFNRAENWLSSFNEALPKQALVVNFVRFLVAIEDLEHASRYGRNMLLLHPYCTELITLVANIQRVTWGVKSGFSVFQVALSCWPKDRPGSQLLWGQYAGYALEWEGDESALLVLRNSIRGLDSEGTNAEDTTYSLMNVALLHGLSGNTQEAQAALERALSSSEADVHCWMEYAAFRISTTDFRIFRQAFVGFLDRCHFESRLSSKLTPLGRDFLKGIKKRKIRSFIDNVLGTTPPDHSFVNSLLNMFFGRELLPNDGMDVKTLGDFTGGLLEVFPANYALALSFCKRVRGSGHVAASGWAASLLLSSLRVAYPHASEACWLETGDLLKQMGLEDLTSSFYKHAVKVYPYSAKLWRQYIRGSEDAALAAKDAGLTL